MINRIVLTFLISIHVGCSTNEIHSEYKFLSNFWPIDKTLDFTLPVLDPLIKYNLFFHIRNTNEFKYSNLFLISTVEFPNGKTIIDTLEYQMATPDGKWLGSGNRLKENKLWYKENIQFLEEGNYKILLRHAMRNNASIEGVNLLEGITDVGVIIEKNLKDNE